MYIESIELDNFKSFGEKVFIPLFPGFTTVSGPNGSGKSNIIDSLLFALGLSTNKTMRAERVTDLMNNLSGKKETRVSVVFYDEESKVQLKVARRIKLKKSNQYDSQYYLNDKASTLTHIHDELMNYNISPNAYNVVMQGDVTRIISMSNTERRKIIDELAGVAQFDRKIDSAQLEINQALDKLNSQTILLSEFSERVEALRSERDIALQYRDLRTKRNKLEILLRYIRIQELEKKVANIKLELDDKTAQKAEYTVKLGDLQEEYNTLNDNIQELNSIIDNLDKHERQEILALLDNKKTEYNKLISSTEYIKKQIQDYTKQIDIANKEQELSTSKINTIQDRINIIRKQKAELTKELDKYESQYINIQNQIKEQSDSFNQIQITELQEEQSVLQKSQSELQTNKAIITEKLQQANKNLSSCRVNLEKMLTELQQLTVQRQNSETGKIENQIKSHENYLDKLHHEKNVTEQEIKDITDQIYTVDKQLSKLELKKQVSQENNHNRGIDAVLNCGLSGIHGVLSQLGNVDPEYALALEIAAGARLRSVVVDHDGIAQKLIEFLRARRLGRVTFLPLNKFNHHNTNTLSLPYGAGVIDWAYNLIDYDELYAPVFAYAFGNTLVCSNITNARKYLGQYRIVTLEGDLLDKSGAMTGGSVKQQSNSLLFGGQDATKINSLKDQLSQLQSNLALSQNSVKELNKEIQQTNKELQILHSECSQQKAQFTIGESQYQNLQQQITTDQDSLRQTSSNAEEYAQNLQSIDYKLQVITEKIKTVNNQLISETSKLQNSQLEQLVNESQEVEFEKKKINVELHNLEYEKANILSDSDHQLKNIHKYKQEVNQAQLKILEFEKNLALESAQIEMLEKELKAVQEQYTNIQNKLDKYNQDRIQANNNLVQISQSRAEYTETLKNLHAKINDLRYKQTDITQRLNELKNIKTDNNTELDELKEEYKDISQKQLQQDLNNTENKMAKLEPVNMKAIIEYDEVFAKLNEIKERCESLENEQKTIQNRINSYGQYKHESFMVAYHSVNKHFKEIFEELSFGQGELQLENIDNPFEGGLVIQARPRNKKMQRLESMSGGEKSLTALSFLFALQWHNPAPFYAFDEVDMFLDGLNVERLSKMVKKQSDLAQFVVVSLRKPMLEKSDRAIGVCLGKHSYSTVSGINLTPEIIQEQEALALASK